MTNPTNPTATKVAPKDSTTPERVTEDVRVPEVPLEDTTTLTALEDKAPPKGGR